jgi:hypothetical protein
MDFLPFIVAICAFLAGLIACYAFFKLSDLKALSIVRQKAALKGNEVQKDQAERLMAFMLEVKTAFDESRAAGKDVKEFATKELPAIVLKYPDVALKFGTRLYKMLKSGNGIDLDGLIAS